MYDHMPPNPFYHRQFVENQYIDETEERVLFPLMVGYQLYGDIATAVTLINDRYERDGIVIYEVSPDQSVPVDEVSLSTRGLVRTLLIDTLTTRPTRNTGFFRKYLALEIDTISQQRVYELAMQREASELSDDVRNSLRLAEVARIATLEPVRNVFGRQSE